MPRTPETAWVSGSRATSRHTANTTVGTRAARTDRGTSELKAQTTEKTVIGRMDSTSPRGPPIAACRENCSATACRKPIGAWLGSASGASAPCARCSGMRLRHQLVARVEARALALGLGHHPADPQPPARLDARDVPPAEPDDVEAAGAVVELGLEGGHPGAGSQRHRTQGAADRGL